ncbi:MAG TPA: hypothetical protein PLF96_14340, partial [Thermotogota bacterium]|nr:hypothetical protein [Thermotogota bacterium]
VSEEILTWHRGAGSVDFLLHQTKLHRVSHFGTAAAHCGCFFLPQEKKATENARKKEYNEMGEGIC